MQQMPHYGREDMIGPAKVNEIIQRLEPAERKRVEDRAAEIITHSDRPHARATLRSEA